MSSTQEITSTEPPALKTAKVFKWSSSTHPLESPAASDSQAPPARDSGFHQSKALPQDLGLQIPGCSTTQQLRGWGWETENPIFESSNICSSPSPGQNSIPAKRDSDATHACVGMALISTPFLTVDGTPLRTRWASRDIVFAETTLSPTIKNLRSDIKT